MENEKIGKYLQNKRNELGITQADLAKEMGVTFQAVSRWEKGDSVPDLDSLNNLANYYKVTIDEILQREIDKEEQDNQEIEENYEVLIFVFVCISYFIGIVIFTLIKFVFLVEWIHILGYVFLGLCVLGSLMLQNMSYFVMYEKNENSRKWYIRSFIPLGIVVFILIIVSIVL